MKHSKEDQEFVVNMLTRIYTEILGIEEGFGMCIGEGDFRPRVDYFHDAIRAFTSKKTDARERGGRLSIEILAYDLSCLRYIQDHPLSSFKPHSSIQSPSTDIVKAGPGVNVRPKRPDRTIRAQLGDLYQHYAVLYAALLKPFADEDYHQRIDDLNNDVRDLNTLIQELAAMEKGTGSLNKINDAIQHLEDDELRQALMSFLQEEKYKDMGNITKLVAFLKKHGKGQDALIASIESAHMNYSLNQLGIFEGSKDILKKLAKKGKNLVGKFVEASIAEAQREIGR